MDEARLIFPFSLKEREIEMKKRVYTLYRVSTKGQVEKDDIPMQKEACRNFAESQGWEIVKEFSEKGVSGFKKSAKERDELQKIQQAAMEGKFDILLVFMFDRLGRRDDETPFIVEWFTKQGIEVWSVNEGQQRFDTHVDKLMNYIRYWQASGESLKTSVRTRTRLEQLTGEGHYTGGTVAFGYKRVRLGRVNKKNQEVCDLVIDEAEAEIVRLIFHKYVYEGYGAQKLSHYLYEQGVVGRNNKNIPNTSIVRMIKNKGYTGYLINGAVETECPQLRIIEPELFEQAQELRQARTCERGGTSLGTSSKALLTGLVYCGHCGNRLGLTSSGRTHTYADGHTVKEVRPRYSCFYKIRHPGDCDGQSGYGVSKLDSIVEEVVRQIFAQFREVSRKKLLESVKTNDAARIQKKVKKIQKDLESKQKELDDLKAETILVIRGVSALDKELLGTLVAEAREALETLEKAYALDEHDSRILMELDQLYKRLGRPHTERLAFLEAHLSEVEQRDDLSIERITLYNQLGRYTEAKELIAARNFHPWEGGEGKITGQYVLCRIELAKIALSEKRYADALVLLDETNVYPFNLGEGKLANAEENDIWYYKGEALRGLGNEQQAIDCFIKATIGSSEPQQAFFYNDQQPDKIFYQGLAWRALGREDKACGCFNKLIKHGEKHLFDHCRIDYFAVSLPDLAIWEDDLDKRNRIHCNYVMGLGCLGLREMGKAIDFLDKVRELDINHQGGQIHRNLCAV